MSSSQSPANSKAAGLLSVFLVVASMYFAKEVFIPLALAVLFAFLLEPLAKQLERLRIGRVAAALVAVLVAVAVAAALADLVAGQLGEFGKKLPEYEKNVRQKVQKMESAEGGIFGRAAKSFQDLRSDWTPTNAATLTNAIQGKPAQPQEVKPVPVEVKNNEGSPLQMVKKLVGPLLNVLTTLFLVTVFCIFMLVERDDLRARVIHIAGEKNVKQTNQLLDETGARVSRYLLMQAIVNVTYGVIIGLGVWAIGIPNPLLWGTVAALFRYIPYAGPWIAASLPLAVGLAVGDDWSKPLLVLGLFGVVEILTANLVEPWLYGNSTGITPLAVLLAAVFWTWVWGPVGLLLSMPLTVCLVSIGRHVPQLRLLDQLFGEPEKKKAG